MKTDYFYIIMQAGGFKLAIYLILLYLARNNEFLNNNDKFSSSLWLVKYINIYLNMIRKLKFDNFMDNL